MGLGVFRAGQSCNNALGLPQLSSLQIRNCCRNSRGGSYSFPVKQVGRGLDNAGWGVLRSELEPHGAIPEALNR